MRRRWTDDENKVLAVACEKNMSPREISKLLPGRSIDAIDIHIRNIGLSNIYKRSRFNDLTGMFFGNWKVIKRIDDYISPNGRRKTQYLCECQCDAKTLRPQLALNLTTNRTLSCGCLKGKNISKAKIKRNEYDITGEYGVGYTHNGGEFYFDLEDYNLIKQYTWHKDRAGYIVANLNGTNTTIKMHRLVLGLSDPFIQVDHIRHKLNDNRKKELRLVTPMENSWNKKPLGNNTSGKTGVTFDKKSNKWKAQIGYNNSVIVIGNFDNLDDAITARVKAENELFGEYSYLNSTNL